MDPTGDIFVATGNGSSTTGFDFGDAVIRLGPELSIKDYFAADNFSQLNLTDTDLGSISPVLLPDDRVLVAGKDGIARLLNKSNLGHISPPLAPSRPAPGPTAPRPQSATRSIWPALTAWSHFGSAMTNWPCCGGHRAGPGHPSSLTATCGHSPSAANFGKSTWPTDT